MRIKERYELAAELRDRYRAADRRERGRMLDAFCLSTGYDRKHAIRVLRGRRRRLRAIPAPARQRRYGAEFRRALGILWEASGYLCSERLQPFLADLAQLLERHRQLRLEEETRDLLSTVSVATVERNLRELRRNAVGRRMAQTKPGTLLRRQIPVIVGHWRDLDTPGYLEIDLVSHSGEVASGEWVWTLSVVDLSTGWTERAAILGKGQATVVAALDRLRDQLPFPLKGIHPDNGSEFLNAHLVRYCEKHDIALSRSRPEHKNDNAHVEQKNWTLVRRLIGYQRLDTPTQRDWLEGFYSELLRPYANCFQPVMKLTKKEVRDGRTIKTYDRPMTPLQRLLASDAADPHKLGALVELYTAVSPLTLKRQIDRRLAALPVHLETVSCS